MSEPRGRWRERKAYDDRLYVNRESEIRLIDDKCAAGRSNAPIAAPVVCFWGGRGMGKSWLLRELERRFQSSDPARKPDTVCARLDLDPFVLGRSLWETGSLDKAGLVRELWRQLARQAGAKPPPETRKGDARWAREFTAFIMRLIERELTPLILLDSLDELVMGDPDAYEWLEEHVFEQLAITDRVVLVLASRGKPIYLQRWQMRRRMVDPADTQLCAFSREETAQQARKVTPAADELYAYSHGYPLATAFLADDLRAAGDEAGEDVAAGALEAAIANMLVGVERSLADTARRLSALRRVDIEPVRAVLAAVDDPLAGEGDRAIDSMILALRNEHLLYWDSGHKSYTFDAALRRVLADALQRSDDATFTKVTAAATTFYAERLHKGTGYLPWDLPEYLFAACLRSTGRVQALLAELDLREAPAEEVRDEALGALNADKELQAMLGSDGAAAVEAWLYSLPIAEPISAMKASR